MAFMELLGNLRQAPLLCAKCTTGTGEFQAEFGGRAFPASAAVRTWHRKQLAPIRAITYAQPSAQKLWNERLAQTHHQFTHASPSVH